MGKIIRQGTMTLSEIMTIEELKRLCYRCGVKVYNVQFVEGVKQKKYSLTLEGTQSQLNQLMFLLSH